MDSKKIWFITGASKGIGLSLVKQLLKAGHYVAATSRKKDGLILAVEPESDFFLPLTADLTNDQSVSSAIEQAYHKFSKLDVVVNNAGYGIGGSIEELSEEETRLSFAVNVFGTMNVIRHALPIMRKQESGHIINISSIAGIAGAKGWAVYAATKSAVISLSEVLAEDVKSFGIKVTVVAPGAFRTNFLTSESLVLASKPIEAYEAVRLSHAKYLTMDGHQAGDPEKAAQVMIDMTNSPEPPLHLLLGTDALQRAQAKLEKLGETFDQWAILTNSTNF